MESALVIGDLLALLGDVLASPVFATSMIAIAVGLFAASYYMLFTGGPNKTPRFRLPSAPSVARLLAPGIPWVQAALSTDVATSGNPTPSSGRTRQLTEQESWSRARWVSELAASKDQDQAELGKRLVRVMAQDDHLTASARSFLSRVLELEWFAAPEPAE